MTDDGIATSLERVLGDIEDLTSPIGRTRIGVQFRTDYLVRSGGFKSIFDFNLQASPDKSYLLQLIDDPSGRAKRFTRVTTSNDPRLPPVLVEDVIETTSDFKISAMFAKRWHFMTFRFGVLESSGGGGLDFDFFDDSLKFQADVFNFGRDTWPRLRLMAQWEFLPHMVLTAGLDDTLNDASRDWFIGLGVRFDDTDLKSLVPFLPSP
jgi:phospholipid/cholesterol/gamma-HCH transport system substrate-binding protein